MSSFIPQTLLNKTRPISSSDNRTCSLHLHHLPGMNPAIMTTCITYQVWIMLSWLPASPGRYESCCHDYLHHIPGVNHVVMTTIIPWQVWIMLSWQPSSPARYESCCLDDPHHLSGINHAIMTTITTWLVGIMFSYTNQIARVVKFNYNASYYLWTIVQVYTKHCSVYLPVQYTVHFTVYCVQ